MLLLSCQLLACWPYCFLKGDIYGSIVIISYREEHFQTLMNYFSWRYFTHFCGKSYLLVAIIWPFFSHLFSDKIRHDISSSQIHARVRRQILPWWLSFVVAQFALGPPKGQYDFWGVDCSERTKGRTRHQRPLKKSFDPLQYIVSTQSR